MNLEVFSVLHGPTLTLDAWIKNQRWAFAGHDIKFRVGCSTQNAEMIKKDKDVIVDVMTPSQLREPYLASFGMSDGTEAVAVVGQDCLWWRKVDDLLRLASNNVVCMQRGGSDANIRTIERRLLFPRIADQSSLFSAKLVAEWKKDGVNEGTLKKAIIAEGAVGEDLRRFLRYCYVDRRSLHDAIHDDRSNSYGESWAEVALWCASRRLEFRFHNSIVRFDGVRAFNGIGDLTNEGFFDRVVEISSKSHPSQGDFKDWPIVFAYHILCGRVITCEEFVHLLSESDKLAVGVRRAWDRSKIDIGEVIDKMSGAVSPSKIDRLFNLMGCV